MNWALAMVIVALILLVAFPAVGLYLFSPLRARSLKHVEYFREDILLQAHVQHLRLAHPEIIKTTRLDRHPAYLWLQVVLLAFGVAVIYVEAPYSTLGAEALGTRAALGGSLILGGAMSLSGTLLGARIGRWCLWPRVCSNVVSGTLGDDIRVPYVLGWWGALSTILSSVFYIYTVVELVGWLKFLITLGGITSFGVIGINAMMIPMFILRLRRYMTERQELIEEAYALMASEDDL